MNNLFDFNLPDDIGWVLSRCKKKKWKYFLQLFKNDKLLFDIEAKSIQSLSSSFEKFWYKKIGCCNRNFNKNSLFMLQKRKEKDILNRGIDEYSNANLFGEMLKDISPRRQRILRMRLGLEDGIPHTLKEVGEIYGVTRERIRQIEMKALKELKKHPLFSQLKEPEI